MTKPRKVGPIVAAAFLFFASTALVIGSLSVEHPATYRLANSSNRAMFLQSANGSLRLIRQAAQPPAAAGIQFDLSEVGQIKYLRASGGHGSQFFNIDSRSRWTLWSDLGVLSKIDGTSYAMTVKVLDVPYVLIFAILLLPAAIWWIQSLIRGERSHRRRSRQECVACGYDLRATPGKCPECGTTVEVLASESESSARL